MWEDWIICVEKAEKGNIAHSQAAYHTGSSRVPGNVVQVHFRESRVLPTGPEQRPPADLAVVWGKFSVPSVRVGAFVSTQPRFTASSVTGAALLQRRGDAQGSQPFGFNNHMCFTSWLVCLVFWSQGFTACEAMVVLILMSVSLPPLQRLLKKTEKAQSFYPSLCVTGGT